MEYIKPPENQPFIGVIDTGLSADNPDIDSFHVHLGHDYIAGDGNPLLQPGEGSEHGTHVTGIIAATDNNSIGIDGINDQAPIYVARATGSGQWAQALTEIVDAAKDSGQHNAIANLSLDLTQINHDGSVTTRYEFTPVERAALEYARQNGVLIVASAGNDGGVMSVLGQASQEFDNIITVGAAEHIDIPHPIIPVDAIPHSDLPVTNNVDGIPPLDLPAASTPVSQDNLLINDTPVSSITEAQAFDRADYSSYGYGLDIMADGGTTEHPVLSTVGHGVGTMAGTSVATASVTGAASQVWAANPELSYRQVIEILKATATDLKTPGWDMETGAGLLNIVAAVELAKTTTPTPYNPPPFSTPTTWGGEGQVMPMERAASDEYNGKYYDWVPYTIQYGDTLSQIALDRMGDASAYWFIANHNGIANPNLIYAGDTIYIPTEVSAPPPDNSYNPPPDNSYNPPPDNSYNPPPDNSYNPPPPPPTSTTINGYTVDGNFYPVFQNYQGTLGNPSSDVINYSSGVSYQLFDNGSIVSSQYGTFPLYGGIRQTYLNTGGLNGWLGAPTSAEIGRGNGVVKQTFANGYIIWNGQRATAYQVGTGTPVTPPPSGTPIDANPTNSGNESNTNFDYEGNLPDGMPFKIENNFLIIGPAHLGVIKVIPALGGDLLFSFDDFSFKAQVKIENKGNIQLVAENIQKAEESNRELDFENIYTSISTGGAGVEVYPDKITGVITISNSSGSSIEFKIPTEITSPTSGKFTVTLEKPIGDPDDAIIQGTAYYEIEGQYAGIPNWVYEPVPVEEPKPAPTTEDLPEWVKILGGVVVGGVLVVGFLVFLPEEVVAALVALAARLGLTLAATA